MKILFLGVQLASLVNFRGPLLRDLVASGHQVVAVAPEPAEPWLGQLAAMGVRFIEAPTARTGINPFADLANFLWLTRLLRQERPEVLFSFQAKAVIWGTLAGLFAGVGRRIAMIEGLGAPFATGPRLALRLMLRTVLMGLYAVSLRAAHVVFFLNPDDRDFFVRWRLLGNKGKAVLIPGIGVDLQHYAAKPLPPEPVMFLFMARLLVDKGVLIFAEAARQLAREHSAGRFVILGPEDVGPAAVAKGEIAAWQAAGVPLYAGATDDVRTWLQQCHVFVLPTFYREGMPRSLLEAMATGRALITTDVPGARETVVAGENGYLIQPRDVNDLVRAMKTFILEPELAGKMGLASRKLAEERFEVHKINRQIISAMMGTKA